MIDLALVQAWLAELTSGWAAADPERIGNLFTPDAVYQTSPYATRLQGRRAIVDYWRSELSGKEAVTVKWGVPVIDGRRVAVEWWAGKQGAGLQTTDAGVLILGFDDAGLCSSLREYWMLTDTEVAAPPGWGQ